VHRGDKLSVGIPTLCASKCIQKPLQSGADAEKHWRQTFLHWPQELRQRRVLGTSFDEQVPFHSFLTEDGFLPIERRTPADTMGTHDAIIPFSSVLTRK